jgi:SulP family sulfate permease
VGQGIGNMVSGLFGGLPGAGATMGTVVGIQAGARTALAGLVRVAILLIVVFWAAGVAALIPLAVLAAIAIKVGVDIIDWGFLRRAHRISTKGAVIAYSVILLTVFVDLIVAVGIGLFVANILTVTRLSEMQSEDVKAITDPDECDLELSDKERELLKKAKDRVLLLDLRGNMIFGISRAISRKSTAVQNCQALVIDFEHVSHLGVSAGLALEKEIMEIVKDGRRVFLVGAEGQALERLGKLGIIKKLPEHSMASSLEQALCLALKEIPEGVERKRKLVHAHAA